MTTLFDLPFEDDEEPAAEPVQEPAGPATSGARKTADAVRRIFTVTELTIEIRDRLEEEFFQVWVEGELSNCRHWNGHLYFTLKDQAAQLKGFIFRSSMRYLKFKPQDGLRVIARGKLSVYEPKGEYQLVCEHLEPQGFGALQLAFEQLKKRLQAEGLFDTARKRQLPALPRKIGIVTSLDGAAIRDMINVLARRYGNAHLVIRPSRVQGEGAAADIAHAIRSIAAVPGVDVIIVGRGGGSLEDLWAFNEEPVARAIYHARVPVVSAVGHESDVTIADLVADLRAPTPSAAAELVVTAKDEFRRHIDRLSDRLRAAARSRTQGLSRRVHVLAARPAFAGIPGRIAMRGRDTADLTYALKRAMHAQLSRRDRAIAFLGRKLDGFDIGRQLARIRTRLTSAEGRLSSAAARPRHRAALRLRDAAGRLASLSPLAVLSRGYAVAWNDRRQVLRDASAVVPGDRVSVTLQRGEIDCIIERTMPEARNGGTGGNGGTG